MTSSSAPVQKILVVTLSNLGDVILTLPVLQSLAERYPKAALHVIVGPSGRGVFEGNPRVAKVTVYEKKTPFGSKWRLLNDVRRERYDLIVDLKHSLIGWLGGARYRNAYGRPVARTLHKALRHLTALKGLAGPVKSAKAFIHIPEAAERSLRKKLEDFAGTDPDGERWIVAAPGSKSDIKKWPPEHFARLLDRLALADGCRIVLSGDERERADSGRVLSQMTQPALDLSGRTDLGELAALLRTAKLLISNDSAPLHLADALETPALALFGPTDPRKYGPRSPRSLVARNRVFCSPCERAQCRFGHECLSELSPDAVYRSAQQLLYDRHQPRNLNILVLRLDRIGDVVLTLPALAAIRGRFPNATISVVTRPATRALLDGHPLVDEVIAYDYQKRGRHSGLAGNARFIREIVMRRFDIAFVLHPSHRAHLVPFAAGIPYRIGFGSGLSSLTLTRRVADKRHEGKKHESEYTLDIVRAFAPEAHPPSAGGVPADLPVYADDVLKVAAIEGLSDSPGTAPLVALHAGASCASKRWPVDRFERLARMLSASLGCRFVIVGGPEEKAAGERLKRSIGDRVVDLTGRLDLKLLPAVLSRARLLISNDSGPVHVAAAVGTRTLVLYGRTREGLSVTRWKALGPRHAAIQKDVGCVNCLAHACTIDFECLKAISVEEVFETAKAMLADAETPVAAERA